ncbi:uncharacterized protein (DUF305 family) [Actinokineospora baliensis]|uniref:DUF305 domain-containing protein n=1 Tax=Actinokineospora baliensis TaxID=547056 RepID=UPI00195E886A|nr:DUF305 domain-containing protein [Actinokineospora baliensis]MBM7773979.1 uncharacterized protein (DUF305 family) [Actinokineospora baliensis]
MTSKTLVRSALAVLASFAMLTACGTTTARDSSQHNAADTAFAQQMIPHHTQAVDMAELVTGRTTNPKIIDLAARIKKAQAPEIATLTEWLKAWGESEEHSMPGMDHGSGMMTADEMTTLRTATGDDFDQRWLTMMIAHHQGAVEMARTELAQGANPEAKKLAQRIIDT